MSETLGLQQPTSDYASPKPTRRVLWKWSLLASAVLLALVMWQCGSALYHGKDLSNNSVKKFHEALNAAQYQDICQSAVEGIKTGKNHDETMRLLQAVHTRLGSATTESLINLRVNVTASGTFITAQYATKYERGTAAETFTWEKVNGVLELYSYNIQSNALIFGADNSKADLQ